MSSLEYAFPRLSLKHLRQLMAIADKGSLRQAAEALALAQPALSRSIKGLEDDLQVKLMNRGPRGVELTSFGETLVNHARLIEANLRFAEEEFEELRGAGAGHVKLGIGPFEGNSIVHIAVDRLLAKRPDAVVNVTVGSFEPLLKNLLAGELDMMLGPHSENDALPGIKFEILTHSRPVIAVRSGHAVLKENKVDFERLAELEWVLPRRGNRARTRLENVFIRQGLVPPKCPVENSPSALTVALIEQRDLIALLPRQLIRHEVEKGSIKILPIDTDEFILPVQLTTREFGRLSPACKAMIAEIRQVCLELGDEI